MQSQQQNNNTTVELHINKLTERCVNYCAFSSIQLSQAGGYSAVGVHSYR